MQFPGSVNFDTDMVLKILRIFKRDLDLIRVGSKTHRKGPTILTSLVKERIRSKNKIDWNTLPDLEEFCPSQIR